MNQNKSVAGKKWNRSEVFVSGNVNTPVSSAGRKFSVTGFLDTVVTFSFAAIAFGLPLFFTSLTMQGIIFDKTIYFYFWILIAAVAWAVKGAITGELVIKRTPLDWPIVGLLAAVTISAFLAEDRWHAFWGFFGDPSRGLMMLIALLVMYYILMSHFTLERFKWIFVGLLLGGAVVTVWTFLALLNVPFLPESLARYAPLSLLGSLNSLTLFLSMMLPLFMTGAFAAVFAAGKTERRKGFVLRAAAGGLVLLTLLTLVDLYLLFGYVSWLALTAGAVFFLIYILAHMVRAPRSLVWLPMLAVVIISGFMMIGQTRCTAQSTAVFCKLPPVISQTTELSWQIARDGWRENMFFGAGPASYGSVFAKHHDALVAPGQLFTVLFYQGKGVLFEALPTIGAVGVFAAIILVLTYIGVVLFLLSRNGRNGNKIYSLGFAAATTVAIAAALFLPLEGSIVMMASFVAALTLALVFAESETPLRQLRLSLTTSPKFALTMAFISLVLIVGVGMAAIFVGKVLAADIYAGQAVSSGKVDENSIEKLSQAISLYPQEGRYYARLGQEYMILANREAFKKEEERDVAKLRNYLVNARQSVNIAASKMPNDVYVAQLAARIAENWSYYDPTLLGEVRKLYARVNELEPNNVLAVVKRGELAIRQAALIDPEKEKDKWGETLSEAQEFFTQAIEMTGRDDDENFSGYAPAYYQRALVREALGDIDGAIEDTRKAFLLSGRTNIAYIFNLGRLYQQRGNEDDMAAAEQIFKEILGVKNKQVADDINVRSRLAVLYAQSNRRDDAIAEYEEIIKLLPEDADELRKQVRKLIDELRTGGVSTADDNARETSPVLSPRENTESENVPSDEETETRQDSENSLEPETDKEEKENG